MSRDAEKHFPFPPASPAWFKGLGSYSVSIKGRRLVAEREEVSFDSESWARKEIAKD